MSETPKRTTAVFFSIITCHCRWCDAPVPVSIPEGLTPEESIDETVRQFDAKHPITTLQTECPCRQCGAIIEIWVPQCCNHKGDTLVATFEQLLRGVHNCQPGVGGHSAAR